MSEFEIEITNYGNEGSLSISQELGCIDFTQAGPAHSPPDLFNASKECVYEDDFINAAKLCVIARIYGAFDSARVADKSARQAIKMLEIQYNNDVRGSDMSYLTAQAKILAVDSDWCFTLKKALIALGHPTYHPTYMILHGMSAFTEDPHQEPFIKGYDPKKIWAKVLAPIKCAK